MKQQVNLFLRSARSRSKISSGDKRLLTSQIPARVFMRNYFNPAWIGDLEGRAVKGAEKIMEGTLGALVEV